MNINKENANHHWGQGRRLLLLCEFILELDLSDESN